jgi:predicted transcriptional regulator
VALTPAGEERAATPRQFTSLTDLHDAWYRQLSTPQARILQELIARYPLPMDRDELADLVGASATSGAYKNNLGRLRSLGLVDYPASGQVVATRLLFPREDRDA